MINGFLPVYLYIRLMANRTLRGACRRQRGLVLTYDDGPGAALTPLIMETLGRHEAKATFFLLGRRSEPIPELSARLASEGHDLGVHTFEHLRPWRVTTKEALADIERGYEALSRWVPANGLFRPPHGKLTWATWRALRRRGAPICWWTHDSGDTWPELPSVESVVDAVERDGGGVVLMHDFDREPERHAYVLALTEALLTMARRKGLRVMTMSELLGIERGSGPRAL